MTPDPEWVARLEGMSDKFKELGRKAREAVATRTERPGSEEPAEGATAEAGDLPRDAQPSEAGAAAMAAGAAGMAAVADDEEEPADEADDGRREGGGEGAADAAATDPDADADGSEADDDEGSKA
jgi:hypothetical protein